MTCGSVRMWLNFGMRRTVDQPTEENMAHAGVISIMARSPNAKVHVPFSQHFFKEYNSYIVAILFRPSGNAPGPPLKIIRPWLFPGLGISLRKSFLQCNESGHSILQVQTMTIISPLSPSITIRASTFTK